MASYNIYCDESCHLEQDHQPAMLLGAIWCLSSETRRLSNDIMSLKGKHRAKGELKWTKVSRARHDFYNELAEWFLHEPAINFRGLVVPNKYLLNHAYFNQGSHDTFYYKMYFSLLKTILNPDDHHNIYLDVKDTRSRQKVNTLRDVLCNNRLDFTREMIHHIQNIRSHDSNLLQITDFLLGAVAYRRRDLHGNPTKEMVVHKLEEGLGRSLLHSTPLRELKFNLFLLSLTQVQ